MSVNETLEYDSFATITTVNPRVLQTRTTNDLIGPQIGGCFAFYSIPNTWISFDVKGAICGNNATEKTGDALGTPSSVYSTHVATAFVGDLELMFNWRVTPHCVARFGYQAMWVDGLALAARNLGPAGTASKWGRSIPSASTPPATWSITGRTSAWKSCGRRSSTASGAVLGPGVFRQRIGNALATATVAARNIPGARTPRLAALFVPQRFDRVETAGFQGGIIAEEHPHRGGKDQRDRDRGGRNRKRPARAPA